MITVHLGHQKIKIIPEDTKIRPFTIILNSVRPEKIGTSNNTYDELIISRAHQVGIPPQFIKGQVEHESGGGFNATAYRYEPITVDLNLIQPQLITTDAYSYDFNKKYFNQSRKRYGKYLFRPNDRISVDNYLIDQRSLYQVMYKGALANIPLDYETTSRLNRYTPLLIKDIFFANSSANWPYPKTNFDGTIAQTIIASSYGLMQLLYTTAVENGLKENGVGLSPTILFNPSENLKYGAKYLVKCIITVNNSQEEVVDPEKDIAEFLLYFGLGHSGYNRGLKQDVISSRDFGLNYRRDVLTRIKKYEIVFTSKVSEGWGQ